MRVDAGDQDDGALTEPCYVCLHYVVSPNVGFH